MKDLKKFINNSQSIQESRDIDKLNFGKEWPDRVLVQPGFDEQSGLFGILLCEPESYDSIIKHYKEIQHRAIKLGFRPPWLNLEDWIEEAGINLEARRTDKYTLFAPAGENSTYWTNIGHETDGVEIVAGLK